MGKAPRTILFLLLSAAIAAPIPSGGLALAEEASGAEAGDVLATTEVTEEAEAVEVGEATETADDAEDLVASGDAEDMLAEIEDVDLATEEAQVEETVPEADDETSLEDAASKSGLIASGTSGSCTWSIDSAGTLVIKPTKGSVGTLGDWSKGPWSGSAGKIKSVRFEGTVRAKTCKDMFSECSSLVSVDLTGLDTSSVTNMYRMFAQCHSLASIDLSRLNTANVTNMCAMLGECTSLTYLDLTSWNTSKVTDMSYMFAHSSGITYLDLSGWKTSSVTDLSCMFRECSSLITLDVSGWSTKNVTSLYMTFNGCSSLVSLDLSSWNTARVTDLYHMFYGCKSLSELKLGKGCTKLGDLPTQPESQGRWKSAATGNWYSSVDILKKRLGIADTYTSGAKFFADVSEETSHADSILWLAKNVISTGWNESDGTRTFRPNDNVKRGDMAAFLFRLARRWGMVKDTWQPSGTNTFRDVTTETSHYRAIMWLAQEGISTGWKVTGGKEFRPNAEVKRGDMAAFMYRLAQKAGRKGGAKSSKSFFSDVSSGTSFHDEIWWLAGNGVTQGWETGAAREYRPNAEVKRGDMAAFLHRLDSVK